jgi:hypothetical protein
MTYINKSSLASSLSYKRDIRVYLSSTKLEIRAKQFLLGSEGMGGEGGVRGRGEK